MEKTEWLGLEKVKQFPTMRRSGGLGGLAKLLEKGKYLGCDTLMSLKHTLMENIRLLLVWTQV